MTNQIQFNAFNFKSSQVRVITDQNQEFWFCGKDVCDILGYTNDSKALKDHCKEKGVTKRYSLTEGGKQELTFINEPNLYRLIIKSRKPEAEPFETWVFEEVLPQIRKTGSYALQNAQQNRPLAEEKQFTFTLKERELQMLAWDWFALLKCVEFVELIQKPLELLHSPHSARAYGIVSEYGSMLKRHRPLLERLTAEIKLETWGDESWNRVLPELRKGESKGKSLMSM